MAGGRGRDRSGGGPSPALLPAVGSRTPLTGRSTIGRPRTPTDDQVKATMAEHARFTGWRALRQNVKSQRQLAREFGVSQATISLAVRSRGQYMQPSPERLAGTLAARRAQSRRDY
jgi:hypothetical protein